MFNDKKFKISQLQNQNEQLNEELLKYKNIVNGSKFQSELDAQQNKLTNISNTIKTLQNRKRQLDKDITQLYNDDISDLSQTSYMFEFSSEYKQKIDHIRAQENSCKNVIYMSNYINSMPSDIFEKISESTARMMQIVFDLKCDDIMSRITYSNKTNLTEKIRHLALRIENQNKILGLTFNPMYVTLKIDEIYTVFQYRCKVRDEKEQRNEENEILKDQAKADKEIKRNLDKHNKDLINLKYKYNKYITENKDTSDIEKLIKDMQSMIDNENKQLTNNKSGYVYVIGNRDMKDGLVKIGVTRRNNIEERMSELSDASHSFPMEVYGYKFVNDCYGVETKIHQYLNNHRLNVNNKHKEWFVNSLDEIETAFKKSCDIDIDLSEKPCKDYLTSIKKFTNFY